MRQSVESINKPCESKRSMVESFKQAKIPVFAKKRVPPFKDIPIDAIATLIKLDSFNFQKLKSVSKAYRQFAF
jgi:hypothetical protein